MKTTLWVGIILVLAGFGVYGKTYYDFGRLNGRPFSMPISLIPGRLKTNEFELHRKVLYDVQLVFDKANMDPQRTACLSGANTSERVCKGLASVVDISWTVLESNRPVAHGTSADLSGGNEGERIIGSFRPSRSGPYSLSAEVRKDGSALDVADPQLQIVIDLFEGDGIAMSQAFGTIEAAISCGLGVLSLLLSAWFRARRRKFERQAA